MAETQMIDSAILKKTQNMLGKFVGKSTLTDKLLSKPPFRFVHDVITSVKIEETTLCVRQLLSKTNFSHFNMYN